MTYRLEGTRPGRGRETTSLAVPPRSSATWAGEGQRGMKLGYFECFVLVSGGSPHLIQRFLERFVPDRVEDCNTSAPEAAQSHGLYWHSRTEGDPDLAMVFAMPDGATLFGLSCVPVQSVAEHWLAEMMRFLGSDLAFFWLEAGAPNAAAVTFSVGRDGNTGGSA